MFRNYLYRNFLVFLCKGNTALSHLGRLSGGAKPLERHVILYDFYRAKIFDDFFSHVEFVRLENALNPSISPLKIITIAHMTKFESGTDSTGFLPCSFTCFIPLPYPPGFKQ